MAIWHVSRWRSTFPWAIWPRGKSWHWQSHVSKPGSKRTCDGNGKFTSIYSIWLNLIYIYIWHVGRIGRYVQGIMGWGSCIAFVLTLKEVASVQASSQNALPYKQWYWWRQNEHRKWKIRAAWTWTSEFEDTWWKCFDHIDMDIWFHFWLFHFILLISYYLGWIETSMIYFWPPMIPMTFCILIIIYLLSPNLLRFLQFMRARGVYLGIFIPLRMRRGQPGMQDVMTFCNQGHQIHQGQSHRTVLQRKKGLHQNWWTYWTKRPVTHLQKQGQSLTRHQIHQIWWLWIIWQVHH